MSKPVAVEATRTQIILGRLDRARYVTRGGVPMATLVLTRAEVALIYRALKADEVAARRDAREGEAET